MYTVADIGFEVGPGRDARGATGSSESGAVGSGLGVSARAESGGLYTDARTRDERQTSKEW